MNAAPDLSTEHGSTEHGSTELGSTELGSTELGRAEPDAEKPELRPTDRRLLRLLFVNALIGIAAGWAMLAAILYFNIASLRELIAGSPSGLLAATMLAVVFAITFGSASMGTAVFLLPKEDDADGGAPRRPAASTLFEALVEASRPARPVPARTRPGARERR